MEDDKLTAYYDELSRKGVGAARFKQGLGFCSSKDAVPVRGSAIPSVAPSLSSFVRASSPSKTDQFDRAAQLRSIQNKLNQKPQLKTLTSSRSSKRNRSPGLESTRSRSRDRCSKRHISHSPSRDRYSRRRERSRSRSCERHSKYNGWSSRRKENEENDVVRRSPEERRQQKGERRKGCGTDFTKLIEGYAHLAPAERVKAKMKLQLSITTENDETIGKGSGWERFEFNKDAPLDDEEIEAAEDDDAVLMKHIGQSFRFSAVETRHEEQVKAAHDEAIFGASSFQPLTKSDETESYEKHQVTSLINDQVVRSMQQGSWRDRIRK